MQITDEKMLEATVARDLEQLALNGRPVTLELSAVDAWILLAQLQLALRHPQNVGHARSVALRVKAALIGAVAITPALAEIARRGDDAEYDT